MQCFIDYIGLRGAISGIIPDSGLYVNDLPGINLKSLDMIADSDKLNYQNLWNIIQQRAVKKFEKAIYAEFNKRFRLKRIVQSIDLTKQVDKTVVYAPIPQWRGFSIQLTFKNMQRIVASPFQSTFIQELWLYLNAVPVADIAVNIFDMETGDTLDAFSVPAATAVVGWNKIKVFKKYIAYEIFCAYDATAVPGADLYIPPTVEFYSTEMVNWIYGFVFANAYVRGAQTIIQDDPTQLAFGIQSYGLSGIFSVGCTYDGLACNNKMLLGDALQYLLGAEIMIERTMSDRLNRYTTIDKDQAGKALQYFEEEYTQRIQQALEGIDIKTSDSCIDCNAQVVYREMTTQ